MSQVAVVENLKALVDGLNFAEKVERAGRWVGTSKCGGECGIHTRPLKLTDGAGI
jgi:hypothetical protein